MPQLSGIQRENFPFFSPFFGFSCFLECLVVLSLMLDSVYGKKVKLFEP